MTALPGRIVNSKNVCVVASSANPLCDISYLCKNLSAGLTHDQIGSPLCLGSDLKLRLWSSQTCFSGGREWYADRIVSEKLEVSNLVPSKRANRLDGDGSFG